MKQKIGFLILVAGFGMNGVAHAAYSSNGIQVSGDFNADGNLDLAVVNPGSNAVSMLLGNGNGTFATAVNYSTGSTPAAVTKGDFNGDGKLDLAVTNSGGGTVSILLGNGDGTFHTQVAYTVGTTPEGITMGDFNADGDQDLAVVNGGANTVSILLGSGTGTFTVQSTTYAVGRGHGSDGIATSDFDGDGKLDLAVVNNTDNTVGVLFGSGTGTFGTQATHTVSGSTSTTGGVGFGDFNADSKMDLAVVNSNVSTVGVLLNAGNGTFGTQTSFSVGDFTGSGGIAIADYNGDGKLDLAVVNPGNKTISVLLGMGTMGAFHTQVTYSTGMTNTNRAVAVGDFNNDGKLDLVAVASPSAYTFMVGHGDGTFN